MAEMYKMDLDKLKEMVTDVEKESMKKDIAVSKAAEFVVEKN